MSTPTFRDENRLLVEMVREWKLLQEHNTGFKDGDDLSNVLLFAEGGIICMICEHFIRMVVEKNFPGASEGKQLRGLLDFAVARGLFKLPFENQEDGKKAVCDHRNAILHGNFAQAAKQSGCTTVEQYFRERYSPELKAMADVVDFLMRQIDVNTGDSYRMRCQ